VEKRWGTGTTNALEVELRRTSATT
jgi:hypothetical protein